MDPPVCRHCKRPVEQHHRNERIGGGDVWLICIEQATDRLPDMTRFEPQHEFDDQRVERNLQADIDDLPHGVIPPGFFDPPDDLPVSDTSGCVHDWVEGVDEHGKLIEPAFDVCVQCGVRSDRLPF